MALPSVQWTSVDAVKEWSSWTHSAAPRRSLHACRVYQADARRSKKRKPSSQTEEEGVHSTEVYTGVAATLHDVHTLFMATMARGTVANDPDEQGRATTPGVDLGKRALSDSGAEDSLHCAEKRCEELDFKGLLAAHYELLKAMPQLRLHDSGPLFLCQSMLDNSDCVRALPQSATVEDIGEIIDREVIVAEETKLTIGRHSFLCPGDSAFVYSDIDHLQSLEEAVRRRGGMQLITMDPPWENKSASRAGAYDTFFMKRLYQLPVQEMLSCSCSSSSAGSGDANPCEGAFVAVWCTHKEKYQRFITKDLFSRWNVVHCSTWYWAKVRRLAALSLSSRSPLSGSLFPLTILPALAVSIMHSTRVVVIALTQCF